MSLGQRALKELIKELQTNLYAAHQQLSGFDTSDANEALVEQQEGEEDPAVQEVIDELLETLDDMQSDITDMVDTLLDMTTTLEDKFGLNCDDEEAEEVDPYAVDEEDEEDYNASYN